jgi:hypothetical protein
LNTEAGASLLKGISFADFNFAGKSFIKQILTYINGGCQGYFSEAYAAQARPPG